MKLKLILMDCILIVLGLVLFAARGILAVLVLPVIGVVLLAVSVVWKPRKKEDDITQ
jgi:L-asparagine transporter-like permease